MCDRGRSHGDGIAVCWIRWPSSFAAGHIEAVFDVVSTSVKCALTVARGLVAVATRRVMN